jgi:hypothetical protein
MAAKIVDGSYMARGINMEGVKSDNTGNKGVTVTFSIVDEGPYKGALIDWTGWLGENTRERTAESLVFCGYDGTDPKTISKDIVQIVIETEEYIKDPGLPTEKKYLTPKVRWVNDPSRSRTSFTPLDPAEKQEAFAGLRGLILDQTKLVAEARAKAAKENGSKPAANNFDFGANAQPPAAPTAATEPNKKAMF